MYTRVPMSPNHRALQIGRPFKSALSLSPSLGPWCHQLPLSPASWVPKCLSPHLPHMTSLPHAFPQHQHPACRSWDTSGLTQLIFPASRPGTVPGGGESAPVRLFFTGFQLGAFAHALPSLPTPAQPASSGSPSLEALPLPPTSLFRSQHPVRNPALQNSLFPFYW